MVRKEKCIEEKNLIVKSNDIVEASYRLTLQEQRVILYMASQIKKEDDDFKPICLNVSDFITLIQVKGHSKYDEIIKVAERLRKRDLAIRQPDSILHIGWLSSVEYFHKKGYVELEFSPKLKPYLLQLKERFTKYYLKCAIHMHHSYSIRFYELLKQYESIGWRYFELNDLMDTLGIKQDEYKLYADFKRRVLKPVKAEFDKKYQKKELDFTFEFEEHKKVRKVVGLRFDIQKPQQLALEMENKSDTSTETEKKNLVEKLLEIKLSRRQAQSKVNKYPTERILRNIELMKQKNEKGEINNLPAFLIDAIENDYAKNCKHVDFDFAKLRAEARKCWINNSGSCRARWNTYKNDQSHACHFCAKFEKQRSLV